MTTMEIVIYIYLPNSIEIG